MPDQLAGPTRFPPNGQPIKLSRPCHQCRRVEHRRCGVCGGIVEHHDSCRGCGFPVQHHVDDPECAAGWEAKARMADAKRAAGFELNDGEREALEKFPNPRVLTIEGYR